MKTALITASYLEGSDKLGNDRLERNLRYLDFYSKIQEELGFEKIFFIDNASPLESVELVEKRCPLLKVLRYPEHLTGGAFAQDYLYCWRALYTLPYFIDQGFEKLLCIDSDFFILSKKMAKWTKDLSSGWNTVWCKRHNFPESGFQVICKDAFPILREFVKTPMQMRNGALMERMLPFTDVNREFNCDRFGESGLPQMQGMDLYGQAKLTTNLNYGV